MAILPPTSRKNKIIFIFIKNILAVSLNRNLFEFRLQLLKLLEMRSECFMRKFSSWKILVVEMFIYLQLFMNFPGKSFLIDVNCATTFVMDESDFYDKGKSVEKGRSQTRSFLSLIMNCENTVFCENSRKTQEKL